MTLKEWLQRQDISPAEFASSCGVSRVTVYRWLNGTRTPSFASRKVIHRKTNWWVKLEVWG